MTTAERRQAFDYLLEKVQAGGTVESVHGLFLADPSRATCENLRFIEQGILRPEAEVAVAWNLYRMNPNADVLPVFIRHLGSPDSNTRQVAVSHLPTSRVTPDLLEALKGLVLVETVELTHLHAVRKFLVCLGISESANRPLYANFYRQLRGDHAARRHAVQVLTDQYGLASK